MSAERIDVVWADQVAIAALPAEVDVMNAAQVGEALTVTLHQRPCLLIIDMTATTFCDSAGITALVRAYKMATANGGAFKLVVATAAVRRVLTLTGLISLLETFPSIAAAMGTASLPETDAPGGAAHH